jgi:threonine aldolase
VDSNLVFFEINSNLGTAVQFCGALREQGILIGPMGGQRMRAVTHLDVSAEDVSRALEVVRSCLAKGLANQTATVGSGPYSK